MRTHKQHHTVVGIYLTPDGDAPSNAHFIPCDYETVAQLALQTAQHSEGDLRTLLTHYTELLRRHVVTNTPIADLCRQIYKQHQRALDLIYEHRPDREQEIATLLQAIVQALPNMLLDKCGKDRVRFIPKALDLKALKQQGHDFWTPSGRMLLFYLRHQNNKLKLQVYLGPGPEQLRVKLFKLACSTAPFKPTARVLRNKTVLFERTIMASTDEVELEQVAKEARQALGNFVKTELPAMTSAILSVVK